MISIIALQIQMLIGIKLHILIVSYSSRMLQVVKRYIIVKTRRARTVKNGCKIVDHLLVYLMRSKRKRKLVLAKVTSKMGTIALTTLIMLVKL